MGSLACTDLLLPNSHMDTTTPQHQHHICNRISSSRCLQHHRSLMSNNSNKFIKCKRQHLLYTSSLLNRMLRPVFLYNPSAAVLHSLPTASKLPQYGRHASFPVLS